MIKILNYGAGINSTALIIELKNRKIPIDYIIFSDTGEEMPETYQYITYIKKWFSENNYKFIIVSSNYGHLYEYYFNKNTIPWRKFRDCTDKFKKTPIMKFIKQFKKEGVIQYIGISYEEFIRARTSEIKWIAYKYPLIELKIDRLKCIEIIKKEGLLIPIKSGCYLCPFQADIKWASLYKKNRDLFNKARKIEENNKSYPKNTLRWTGTLKSLENAIKTQTKLSDFEEKICGGFCFT